MLCDSTRAGRTLVLYSEMHRSFHVIKPMIKNPTFASVDSVEVNVDTSAQMLQSSLPGKSAARSTYSLNCL